MWITNAVRISMCSDVLLDLAEVISIERLVLVELLVELLPNAVAREARYVVPLIVGRWLVYLSERLFVGANFCGSLQS